MTVYQFILMRIIYYIGPSQVFGHSTLANTALVHMIDSWLNAMDNGALVKVETIWHKQRSTYVV